MFGEIVDGEMIPNEGGRAVEACWRAIPCHFPKTALDAFVVMPNHVHGIVEITVGANNDVLGANDYSPLHGTSRTIGSIVRGFKTGVTKWFRAHTDMRTVWQRNYYEHIIRNDKAHLKIAEYIENNPHQWMEDRYHV